jgi:tRNA threonylcarbamoyladenosine biosynthesis protein TsaB
MRYLYIDTSSSYLYTAIVEDNKLISSISEEYGQNLSEVALPKIASMFESNNLNPKDIQKIIVVNGPGSFTGIRIGITIAKIYAWSLNIEITTITSLEAMAVSSNKNLIHIPILNARRGYVYSAIYDKDITILKPQHIKFEELMNYVNKIDNYEFISNDKFENLSSVSAYSPDYIKIIEKYKDKEAVNPHSVNPDYLKLTEAEEKNNDL